MTVPRTGQPLTSRLAPRSSGPAVPPRSQSRVRRPRPKARSTPLCKGASPRTVWYRFVRGLALGNVSACLFHLRCVQDTGVCGKNTLPEKKTLGKMSFQSIKTRGWRALSATELLGKGLPKRNMFFRDTGRETSHDLTADETRRR